MTETPNIQLKAYPAIAVGSCMTIPMHVLWESKATRALWCRDAAAVVAAVTAFGGEVARLNPGRSFALHVGVLKGQRAPSGFRKRVASLGDTRAWNAHRWLMDYPSEAKAPVGRWVPLEWPEGESQASEPVVRPSEPQTMGAGA